MVQKGQEMHPLEIFKFCPKCGGGRFQINSSRSKKCDDCGFEYYKNPIVGVCVAVFDNMDRMLCIRRDNEPGRGMLGLPGGFTEFDETLEQTAVREVVEETGAKIELTELVANIPNSYVFSGLDVRPLDFYFTARLVDGSHIKPQPGEVSDILFIPRDEIDIDAFAFPSARQFLKKLLNK